MMANEDPDGSITLPCPAKLNLALSVGAPRPVDGLHPIASWMATIDLCDELTLARRPDESLTLIGRAWHAEAPVRSDLEWPLDRDLVARAHTAMERAAGRPLKVKATLRKRIPVGAGLGGGSSNAAATLVGLNRLFELGFSQADLENIGFTLGSDVAFFIRGGAAIVEGLGETIESIDSPVAFHAVVAMPGFGCATGQVYKTFDRWGPSGTGVAEAVADGARVRGAIGAAARGTLRPDAPLWNDLAFSACDVAPRLAGIREELEELAGAPAHVTGSGSTVFALCADECTALALAEHASRALDLPVRPVRGPATSGGAA